MITWEELEVGAVYESSGNTDYLYTCSHINRPDGFTLVPICKKTGEETGSSIVGDSVLIVLTLVVAAKKYDRPTQDDVIESMFL